MRRFLTLAGYGRVATKAQSVRVPEVHAVVARLCARAMEPECATRPPAHVLDRRGVARGVPAPTTGPVLRTKRMRGVKTAGECAYGYGVDATGAVVPYPAEQAVIARVRALRADGASLRAIVARLASEGVVSRVGRPLRLTQVVRVVRGASPEDATS